MRFFCQNILYISCYTNLSAKIWNEDEKVQAKCGPSIKQSLKLAIERDSYEKDITFFLG